MDKKFDVYATSSPTGLNILCRKYHDSDYAVDCYVVKMIMNPESCQRYLSFSPLFPLAEGQTMPWLEFKAFANRDVHCGLYTPAAKIQQPYLNFVDNYERVSFMRSCYLEECGPNEKWLKEQAEARGECYPPVQTIREGKVLKGAFAHVEEE